MTMRLIALSALASLLSDCAWRDETAGLVVLNDTVDTGSVALEAGVSLGSAGIGADDPDVTARARGQDGPLVPVTARPTGSPQTSAAALLDASGGGPPSAPPALASVAEAESAPQASSETSAAEKVASDVGGDSAKDGENSEKGNEKSSEAETKEPNTDAQRKPYSAMADEHLHPGPGTTAGMPTVAGSPHASIAPRLAELSAAVRSNPARGQPSENYLGQKGGAVKAAPSTSKVGSSKVEKNVERKKELRQNTKTKTIKYVETRLSVLEDSNAPLWATAEIPIDEN